MPPPTPVPEREHHEVVRRRIGHQLGLRQRGAVGVVVHEDGYAEPRAQLLAQRTPSSGMFTLESTVPVANSICDGTPTPTASGSPERSTTSATAASIPASSRFGAVHVGGVLHGVVGRGALDAGHRHLRPPHVDAQHAAHGAILCGWAPGMQAAMRLRSRERVASP